VVIPCCNEEATVAGLVVEARHYLPLVIAVDDGSTDQTASRAAGAGAQVIRHPRTLGKGAALKAGLAAAWQQHCRWAVTLDGDGQHRPEDIPVFLRHAEETGAALIIGNRLCQPRSLPWVRRLVNRWMSRRISARAGQFLPDSQCGYRLVNLEAWAALHLATNHFEFESELLLAFARAGHKLAFAPIQVVPQGPHSHIHPVRDTWRWLRWWQRSARG